jgi:hypothetical protein
MVIYDDTHGADSEYCELHTLLGLGQIRCESLEQHFLVRAR